MNRTAFCIECLAVKRNCISIGMEGNMVCIDCLRFNLEVFDSKESSKNSYDTATVTQRTEKIDPNNVPF